MVRSISKMLALSSALILFIAPSAVAAQILYSWSGFVESTGGDNPWGLQGDGAAVTQTDGTPFQLRALVNEFAVDQSTGTLNPNTAEFLPTSVTLTIGMETANLIAPRLTFHDDNFGGLFDSVSFSAQAELLGVTFSFPSSARISASTFNLSDTPAPDAPPMFPDSALVQTGGNGSSDPLVTIAVNTLVTGSVVPIPGDYNQNGTVDAADYTLWRDNLGSPDALPNDDTPGVGADDYTRWKTSFGDSGTGSSAQLAPVPEPATLWLFVIAVFFRPNPRRGTVT